MVVTHLLPLLGLVAMEPPMSMKPSALAAAKLGVFRSLRPLAPAEVVRSRRNRLTSDFDERGGSPSTSSPSAPER